MTTQHAKVIPSFHLLDFIAAHLKSEGLDGIEFLEEFFGREGAQHLHQKSATLRVKLLHVVHEVLKLRAHRLQDTANLAPSLQAEGTKADGRQAVG